MDTVQINLKRKIIERKQIELFGKGEEIRDHIHINDVADIISKLILKDFNGLVNVVSDLVSVFIKLLNMLFLKANLILK